MKSMSGLIIAIGLGMAGAVLNWMYLEQESRQVEKVSFIGVQRELPLGELLREENIAPVLIPANAVGELRNFAVLWDARQTVVGRSANRAYSGGELLLRQDLKTPPPELQLTGKDERAMWIPVDTSSFVPSLVVPGRQVSFLISRAAPGTPTPASLEQPVGSDEPRKSGGAAEVIGPFRVLSLGNRLGSAEVMQAAKIPQLQENVMGISVRVEGNELEPKARKLWDLLSKTNFRQAGVLLHPIQEDK